MKLRTSALAATAAALGMTLTPSAAAAHSGSHPFENCAAAYAAGYSKIAEGDEHYGKHLDRDGDGIGCDRPPAGFVPAKDRSGDGKAGGGSEDGNGGEDGGALAETGGTSATPYLATGGGLVLAAGAGVLVATRRRRTER
ncbi:LPXTG-motif cell wall anchor domain-containing protein [Streptomyces sp. WMMB 714]|uniref:excalibur calcium-binding domain-containing protein n=1 Tax=Streptomyces sp. WMMB 714 TaxID=1286822 RepID=UPI0005F7F62A|nr:excalibur calcium-binding domain-containing protein [Streptomyces sp. WMMB 714]SCK53462.1 LPXTG-motif cell wall anchor domain-containing protein [Streptomyces sp. WMMB 714]